MKYWKTFKIYIFWKLSCEGNFHGIRVKRKCMYLLSNIPIHTMHAHRLNVLVSMQICILQKKKHAHHNLLVALYQTVFYRLILEGASVGMIILLA